MFIFLGTAENFQDQEGNHFILGTSREFPRILFLSQYTLETQECWCKLAPGKKFPGIPGRSSQEFLRNPRIFFRNFARKIAIISAFENMSPGCESYNFGQNCWENCILGQHFSKHRSCTGSSLSPFPWKQCCCVFKRKPDPWAFVESNIELGEGVFFPQRCRFGNSFVAQESGHDGENFLK